MATRATKTTTAKAKVVDEKEIVNEKVETPIIEKEEKKELKTYNLEDRIPCKSVTSGLLVYYSTKTQERYEWSNYGDVVGVLYSDLSSMKSAKSQFIFKPYFVIEDEDLLSDIAWKKVKELYNTVDVVENPEDYLNQTPEQLRDFLKNSPEGVRNTIRTTASQMLSAGTLDSIKKIKVIDEVLGTQFHNFI